MPTTRKLEFPNAQGDVLAGALTMPDLPPRAFVLFAHCFTCGKDLRAAVRLSMALAQEGVATMRFDFTGIGESEGDFADTSFSSNVQDLVAAADMMRERFEAPQILIGHSLGGAAVLVAAHQVPEAKAVATVGAPCDPAHVRRLIEPGAEDIDRVGHAEVSIAGRKFTIKKQFLDDLEDQEARQTIAQLKKALCIFHSPQDQVVDIDNARRIYQAAKHPKSFISLHDADHLLRSKRDADYVGQVLSAWVARYLEDETEHERYVEQGIVEVEGGPAGYTQRVHAGPHRFVADEPESVPGGTDAGPTPYDLLLASLGTCTSMTLRMYADRKGWPLEGVRVRLEHGRIHAEDCEDCKSKTGMVSRITRKLEVFGESLDDEQRQRLVEIADKCPIHKTLVTETVVRTELVERTSSSGNPASGVRDRRKPE